MLEKLKVAGQSCHAGTWWLAGFGFAIIAGQASSFLAAFSCIAVALGCTLFFRTAAPWAQSIRFYLSLSAFIVAVRVAFRIAFNAGAGQTDLIAFTIPPLRFGLGFGADLQLFGPVSFSTLQAATLDGLRLASIILAIAMATSLSNPRRLLKATPAALYEVAAAVSVAINLAPQMIESLQRVRRARALRGRNKGVGALASIVIPALEDTMERSLQLAASMDARGFGRRGSLSRVQIALLRALSLGSAAGYGIGTYLLVATDSQIWAFAILIASTLFILAVIRMTAKQNVKTSYNRERLGWFDIMVFAVTAVAVFTTVAAPTVIGLIAP